MEKVALHARVAANSSAKVIILVVPKADDMATWRMHLGLPAVAAGGYSDAAEVARLSARKTKSFVCGTGRLVYGR